MSICCDFVWRTASVNAACTHIILDSSHIIMIELLLLYRNCESSMSAANKPIKSVPGLNYEILHFSNFVAAAVST